MKPMAWMLVALFVVVGPASGSAQMAGHQTAGQELQQESQEATVVQSRMFDIAYEVNEEALPLDSVQLWYTMDNGRTWQFHGLDNDRQSPYSFQATTEGEYGFTLVLTNSAGVSGRQPAPGDPPFIRAVVDFTSPTVQLHRLEQSEESGVRMVHVHWSAIDTNLNSRPIDITYQTLPDGPLKSLSTQRMANTGRYDWRVPSYLSGAVAIRVAVTDGARHRVVSQPRTIELKSTSSTPNVQYPPARPQTSKSPRPLFGSTQSSPLGSLRSSPRSKAAQLITEGLAARDRGDIRRAITQLREAVRLDPQRPDAFVELGRMLYGMGDMDQSLSAFQLALGLAPTMRSALQGAARVNSRRRNFAEASKLLRTILRHSPNDAETWMNLGDISVFSGDESTARDAYRRAADIDPSATEVIAQAQQRMVLMENASKGQP